MTQRKEVTMPFNCSIKIDVWSLLFKRHQHSEEIVLKTTKECIRIEHFSNIRSKCVFLLTHFHKLSMSFPHPSSQTHTYNIFSCIVIPRNVIRFKSVNSFGRVSSLIDVSDCFHFQLLSSSNLSFVRNFAYSIVHSSITDSISL